MDRNRPPTDAGRGSGESGDGARSVAADARAARRATANGDVAESSDGAGREFLLEVVRREPLLEVLRSGPADPKTLLECVGCSRSTVHRATNALAEYDLLRKDDGAYELTGLGEVVADQAAEFGSRASAAASLEPFLNTIDMRDVPVEHFVDAEITRRKPRQPHASLHRIIELIQASDSLRMLSTVLSPIYVDVGYREMMDGMEIEAVFDRQAVDIMLSEHAEEAVETVQTGRFSVYAHEGLPFELFVLDDTVGMAAHDETGTAEVLVECDAPAAIEWAESLYAEHRAEAEPLALADDLEP